MDTPELRHLASNWRVDARAHVSASEFYPGFALRTT